MAAIGVFRAFENAGIDIDLIVGTSVGSIIGGLYAAGYTTHQLYDLVDSTNWGEVLNFSDEARRRDLFLDQKLATDRSILTVRFEGLEPIIPESFSTGQRLTNYLNLLALQGIYQPAPTFDNLRIPFRAATTDLLSGQLVILDRGDLTQAMRASASVPLLFSPVPRDTAQLLDGGLVSNIPVDAARESGADIVVAVDVTSSVRPAGKLKGPLEVAEQIIGIAMQMANREQRAKADVVIRPDLGDHETNDFTGVDMLLQKGEEAARAALEQVRSLLRSKSIGMLKKLDSGKMYPHVRFQFDPLALDQQWLEKVIPFGRSEDLAESDLRELVTEMYQSGDFESVEVAVTEEAGGTLMQLVARRNPLLNDVLFRGDSLVSKDSLRSLFAPLIGQHINVHRSREALEGLLRLYREKGYSLARIKDVHFDSMTGSAVVEIDEGVVYRRDIRGTTKTKDYVIWRELPWDERKVFQVGQVSDGISNLYGTNLFEQVSISAHREEERNIVVINVRERSTELIRLGMRIDNERTFQPSIDVRDENLLGIGAELGLHLVGGSRNRNYVGEFKATRIFNSYFTFDLKGYYTYRDVNVYGDDPVSDPQRWNRVRVGEYRELRKGGSISFGTQLERLGSVTVEGRMESHRVWSFSGNPVGAESFRIGSIKFGTKVDNLDRFPFPRSGVKMNLSYESAVFPLSGGVGFTKMAFTYDSYDTYFKRHTLHPRFQFGFADETLPITEQFSLGGQESFFGLREDNARGRQMVVASLEYRYESPVSIFFDTYLTARYDFGSIWSGAEEIRLGDLLHGIGLGIAFDTPVGPAEFSVGRGFFFRKDLLNNPVSFGPVVGYFRIGYAL